MHAHLRCPNLWQNVITGLGEIAHICVVHVRRGAQVQQLWGVYLCQDMESG